MKLLKFHERKTLRSPDTPLPVIGKLLIRPIGDGEDDDRNKRAYDLLSRIGNPAAQENIAGCLNWQGPPPSRLEVLKAAILGLRLS